MSSRTIHGDNIANDIQTDDAYGAFNVMTLADLWNILDQFQTHLIDHDPNNPGIKMLSKWMREIENVDPEIET